MVKKVAGCEFSAHGMASGVMELVPELSQDLSEMQTAAGAKRQITS